jgi:AraC-like DNA-binding protein
VPRPDLPADFLDPFTVFDTNDAEVFAAEGRRVYGFQTRRVDAPERLQSKGRFVTLSKMTLIRTTMQSGVELTLGEADAVRFQFSQTGRGRVRLHAGDFAVNDSQAAIADQGDYPFELQDEPQSRVALRLNRAAIDCRLTALLGARPRMPFRAAPSVDLHHPRVAPLLRLIAMLGDTIGSAEMPRILADELEDTILTAFLAGTDHNFTELLEAKPPSARLRDVRRIEEFIEDNWQRALSIEEMAVFAGISARSLFKSFQQERGYTPRTFAKTVRLRKARELLIAPDARTSVIGVALRCGFQNFGHFARDYRLQFGELPSETLRLARRLGDDTASGA